MKAEFRRGDTQILTHSRQEAVIKRPSPLSTDGIGGPQAVYLGAPINVLIANDVILVEIGS